MHSVAELSPTVATSRDRSRRALYQLADALGCRPEVILEAAGSDAFPDETAEMVRFWFKLQSDADRARLLEQGRAMVAKKRG